MKFIRHILILFVFGCTHSFWAQEYRQYSTRNGLPGNHVYRITQDFKGFIWIITDKGIATYDGTSFQTFTTKEGLPTNDIWDIRITPDNKVWFFSKTDKLGYIENNRVYTFENALKEEVLYPVSICQSHNKIAFSNTRKFYTLQHDKWESSKIINDKETYIYPVLHPDVKGIQLSKTSHVLSFLIPKKQVVKTLKYPSIIRGDNYRTQLNDSLFGIISYKRYTMINLNNQQIFQQSIPIADLDSLFNYSRFNPNPKNIQCTGDHFVGIIGKQYQLEALTHIPKELNSHFSFIDKDDNLWIATTDKGVFFQAKANREASYTLKGYNVGKIGIYNGQLIAHINEKGFYVYDNKKQDFTPLVREKGYMYAVQYIPELHATYFCTNRKTIKKTGSRFTTIYDIRKQGGGTSRQIIRYQDKLYGFDSFGLSSLDSDNLIARHRILQHGIRRLFVYDNRLLLATSNGLKKLEKQQIQFVFSNRQEWNKPILSIAKNTKGQLLIGTDGFGAYYGNLQTLKPLEKSEYLSVPDFFVQKNSLWLATNKGVWNYEYKDGTYRLKRKYTVADGLASDDTHAVVVQQDRLFATSSEGISIIPVRKHRTVPDIKHYIKAVHYNGNPINKSKKTHYKTNNHIAISLGSIHFNKTGQPTYTYQLFPVQKDWLQTQSSHIVFNELAPGTYDFRLQSGTNTGHFGFTILPLWYQRAGAKAGFVILSLGLLSLLLYLIRKKELKKQIQRIDEKRIIVESKLYALRSQMNPHFIFNSLNAIQYYITDNKPELSEKYLVKFSKLIRMFFDMSKRKMISIEEEVLLLKTYLEIEKLRFDKNFNFSISVDASLNQEQLIPSMLLQPIVENAVNHGLFHKKGKGIINIRFERRSTTSFEIIIEDNGVGRKKAAAIKQHSFTKHLSKSTQILQERIRLINESNHCKITYHICDVDPENQMGTRVRLVFETQNEKGIKKPKRA